jgi:hypothetical protein
LRLASWPLRRDRQVEDINAQVKRPVRLLDEVRLQRAAGGIENVRYDHVTLRRFRGGGRPPKPSGQLVAIRG